MAGERKENKKRREGRGGEVERGGEDGRWREEGGEGRWREEGRRKRDYTTYQVLYS